MKDLCYLCLNSDAANHVFKCRADRKCYICFSRTHHTFLCPERLTAPQIFLPKIDNDLLIRFTEMLYLEEKLFLVITSPNIADTFNFLPLKVVANLNLNKKEKYSNIIVGDVLIIEKVHSPFSALLKEIILKPTSVILRMLTISIQDFFHLISAKTTKLEFVGVKFDSNMKFSEILKKTPNIENFNMDPTTKIEVEKTWIQDLLEFNLKSLSLAVNDANFSTTDLVTLITTKGVYYFRIGIHVIMHKPFDKIELQRNLIKKYEKSFVPVSEGQQDCRELTISFWEKRYPNIYIYVAWQIFALKNNVV